jgi:hypothetical protein
MIERRVRPPIARSAIAAPKALSFLIVAGSLAFAAATQATVFSREQDVTNLRLGQRAKIDDGTSPAGQIKEMSGTKMTETGVLQARKCVPRGGPKLK